MRWLEFEVEACARFQDIGQENSWRIQQIAILEDGGGISRAV